MGSGLKAHAGYVPSVQMKNYTEGAFPVCAFSVNFEKCAFSVNFKKKLKACAFNAHFWNNGNGHTISIITGIICTRLVLSPLKLPIVVGKFGITSKESRVCNGVRLRLA